MNVYFYACTVAGLLHILTSCSSLQYFPTCFGPDALFRTLCRTGPRRDFWRQHFFVEHSRLPYTGSDQYAGVPERFRHPGAGGSRVQQLSGPVRRSEVCRTGREGRVPEGVPGQQMELQYFQHTKIVQHRQERYATSCEGCGCISIIYKQNMTRKKKELVPRWEVRRVRTCLLGMKRLFKDTYPLHTYI